uniref:Uncharacterized protein n=1 Tax=Setaria italica TaxID=4555 RepID=K3Y442_SETIT
MRLAVGHQSLGDAMFQARRRRRQPYPMNFWVGFPGVFTCLSLLPTENIFFPNNAWDKSFDLDYDQKINIIRRMLISSKRSPTPHAPAPTLARYTLTHTKKNELDICWVLF